MLGNYSKDVEYHGQDLAIAKEVRECLEKINPPIALVWATSILIVVLGQHSVYLCDFSP
jgi:hypothetical protein